MQYRLNRAGPPLRLIAVGLVAVTLALLLRRPLWETGRLALYAAALALLLEPAASFMERRLSRPAAALAAVAAALLAVALTLWLLLPTVFRELMQLAQTLPESLSRLTGWLTGLAARVEARLPGLRLPQLQTEGLTRALTGLATGTVALAGSAGATLSTLSLVVMLGFFFLCDRDRMLLRLELLIPQAFRQTAVRMGNAVLREVRLYLQGQLLIALAVGALSALGLMLIGLKSALVLGGVVGLLNMVPYFGPFIGGLPAVLIALGDGWQRAAMTLAVLAAVQQVDAAVLSPRIMGSLTGLSPATVLVAIYAGTRLSGLGGMLMALPVFMSIRTVFRVFVQSRENI